MSKIFILIAAGLILPRADAFAVTANEESATYGPAAALRFDEQYRGACCAPGVVHCYPKAQGIPLADCVNIVPMTAALWTPGQLCADFRRRMKTLPERERKKGIIVMLKTERCATKAARACTITTAAFEKRSTPLVNDFLVYGVQIKPRDGDNPPGSLPIETGADAWKNKAAGEYRFRQGPGATLVFLDPANASRVAATDASELKLLEWIFVKNGGETPALGQMLEHVLRKMAVVKGSGVARSKLAG